MKTSDKQWKFLQDISSLIAFAYSKDYKLTAGEAWRTQYQQDKYLEDGKTEVSESQHQKRLAMDFNLFVMDEVQWSDCKEWQELGNYWKALDTNNRWGGDFKTLKDYYHFERKD